MKELTRFGIRPGLERIQYLLQQLGHPQQDYPCVHVAGTNGKGTVTQIISQALTNAGYRVGRFTSPHLHDYTERVQVDGSPISHEKMNAYLDQIEACVPHMLEKGFTHPTEFEVLTALAFLYFRDKQVDIAVLEVGLGGTWDSTNVIIPVVSVITGIDYDHMNILGNTLHEIAMNKAGIIKPGVPVVIGEMPKEAMQVIYQTAEANQASVLQSQDCKIICEKVDETGQTIRVQNVFPELKEKSLHFHLRGTYQRRNLATALVALTVLSQRGYQISSSSLTKTLSTVQLPGRLEVVSQKPLVFIDVAHNPQGAAALGESLREMFPKRKKVVVCAILDDKDALAMMQSLAENTRKVIFTKPLGPRGENWQRLLRLWKENFPEIPAIQEPNIQEAVQEAVAELTTEEYMLITGSFYLMDPARRFFLASQTEKEWE